jgi:arylsulfatase A-like enzyme
MHPEVLKVPLVMRFPGWKAVPNAETPVETRNVFWSILDYLGLDAWSSPMAASLLPVWRHELVGVVSHDTPIFSSSLLADAPINSGKRVVLKSVQYRGWKLIRDELRGRTLLYDLTSDPWEQVDLAGREPERVRALEQKLAQWVEAMGVSKEVETRQLDRDDIERLEALGYL